MTVPSAPAQFNATVYDPTPNQALSGTYATGDPQHPTGYQQGYVYADQTGAEACNGNPNTLSRNTPVAAANGAGQGYVWVGQSHQPSAVLVGVPGGYAGAGDNKKTDAAGNDSGAPCPQYHTTP